MKGFPPETPRADTPTGPAAPVRQVLVLDTDAGVRWALEKGLDRSGFRVTAVGSVGEALQIANESSLDCIIMELLPEAGLTHEALSMLANSRGNPLVICVAGDAAPQLVIECMRHGAVDFLPKPFSLGEVRAALSRAFQARSDRPIANRPGEKNGGQPESSQLIGISPPMQELRATIKEVAQTDLNCLIRGESGTGKDMVAREIHRLSRRCEKPFIKVNCTALPEQLLESELFGFEKGAFTGAVASKPGRFELAHRGIIFLDEIGDMHPNLQAKLLQVIEHKEFTKLGGRRNIKVDVQIIAATNADLEARTKDGAFRADLYFRLNEVCIWVPPLSARKEDIPILVRHFIQKHGRFSGEADARISIEEVAMLTEHCWPGNVRELESAIKRWLALGKKNFSELFEAPGQVSGRPTWAAAQPLPVPSARAEPLDEANRIRNALERCQWNRRKAADLLGISYQTLRRRIEQYGLDQG